MITDLQVKELNGLSSKVQFSRRRDQMIMDLVRDEVVLHIGACDAPYHLEKMERGELLQQKLASTAKRVNGLDIDDAAIAALRDAGTNNIYNYDDVPMLPYDTIVCGETIEHITNFDEFFAGLDRFDYRRIIFSTPNGLSYSRLYRAIRKTEVNHPDHKVIFTPAMLAQLLMHYNFNVERIFTTFLEREVIGSSRWKSNAMKIVLPIMPMFAETLVAVARHPA